MGTEQIVKLSPEAIEELLAEQEAAAKTRQPDEQRREERWPFPGTVEAWLPSACYGEQHVLATLHNMSVHGLAMRTRRAIPTGTRISLAIHQPRLSAYGQAVVRHCTRAHAGYLVGVEFCYESEEAEEAGNVSAP